TVAVPVEYGGSFSFSVRHLAEPPAFRNSERSISVTVKPASMSCALSGPDALWRNTLSPMFTALQAKLPASIVSTTMRLCGGRRAEARGDVGEARVGEPERHDRDAEPLPDLGMRLDLGAEPVPDPEARRAAVEQAVAGAFEADLLFEVEQLEAVVAEPLLEV